MKKQVKLWSVLLMIVLASSYAMAVEKAAVQQAGTADQLVIGAQDVITAQDAGGGYMSTRDIILVVIVVFAVIGLIAVL
ncbi:MAG: hypothetical protein NTW95_14020 [Candidatus Aminicenantes bacterium]|nr:hypothetical protein [Candidatus Aminicenantes bacterium]